MRGEMCLASVPAPADRVLSLAGPDGVLAVHGSIEDALASRA
ncbi:hypothetical protein [Streptomyces sp. NPDC057287]